uniref:Uncharacterized protein n=1 Tax=Solanum tuberosum TaxID=4113 RepID=M1DH10_SOLTU
MLRCEGSLSCVALRITWVWYGEDMNTRANRRRAEEEIDDWEFLSKEFKEDKLL